MLWMAALTSAISTAAIHEILGVVALSIRPPYEKGVSTTVNSSLLALVQHGLCGVMARPAF